jgi:7-carboxy-7-deazaguanine synthase
MPNVEFSVETQGSVWQEWVTRLRYCVVSPKGPSSGQMPKLKMNVLDRFMFETRNPFLKVVVFDEEDYKFAQFMHARYRMVPFYVSSGTNEPYTGLVDMSERYRWLCELVAHDKDMQDTTVLPQLHKLAWGNEKGR